MMTKIRIAALIFIFMAAASCEKTEYDLLDPESAGTWTLYSTDTGLPSNQITDITRDSRGNLWVTFESNGAAKYENGTWAFYRTANSDILSNSVTTVASSGDGSVIIGTNDGISILNTTGDWISYRDPLVASMYINCAKVTSNGWVWLGTQTQGFYYDRGSGYEQVKLTNHSNIRTIEEDSERIVWLGTENGLLRWDGGSTTVITTSDGLHNNDITSVFSDRKNRLWIGASSGTRVTCIQDGELSQVSLMNSTPETIIRDIHEDRRGDIWFATHNGGLVRFDGVISHSYKISGGFYENDINCIGEDSDGNIWFGLRSKGLVKYTLPLN
jgi:ligand-binding sensor domain-containing protein